MPATNSDRPEGRELRLTVNGEDRRLDVAPSTPLLYVLRNDLSLNGPKFGCGLGECAIARYSRGDDS